MTEQGERTEKALRGCAEADIPETVDLWPQIQERTAAKQQRGRPRARFAPATRLGWALAILAALFVMTGTGYAATELVDEMFRSALPGVSEGENAGVALRQRQVADGAAVTLERVYADSSFVAVSLNVEDLKGDRRLNGRPAELHPIAIAGYGEGEARDRWPKRVELSDGSGGAFLSVDGQGVVSVAPNSIENGPLASTMVFRALKPLEPGERHRFRLEVPLEVAAIPSSPLEVPEGEMRPKPVGEPFVFEFEVPVRPGQVVEVDQKVEKHGVAITLDRIEDAPGRPQAVFCIEPPDNEHDWLFEAKRTGSMDGYLNPGMPLGDGCYTAGLLDKAETYSSLTVTEIEGLPKDGEVNGPEDVKTIPGPWMFNFEIPEQ